MALEFMLDVFREVPQKAAVIWREEAYTFVWLESQVSAHLEDFARQGIDAGQIVALEGDFSPRAIALLLALTQRRCIVVPLLRDAPPASRNRVLDIAQVERLVRVAPDESWSTTVLGNSGDSTLYREVRERGNPALVLFSSGSSGEPKGAVHDFTALLKKFHNRRPTLSMLSFLMFDHIGGLNTLLHALANGATLITVGDRSPDRVCALIAEHGIEVLPASPTFLNLLAISEAYRRHDLSSLKRITYGSEPMPENTLRRLNRIFPNVVFQQTYGLIELGIFRSKSKRSDSLWVKLGMDYRIVDGILQIKTESAMLGYLNAPSPFTEDGWFHTGDAVEVDGEYLRILGRKSEMINVGGEKVFPQEVENVIQEMPEVEDVLVYKEDNPITGHMVCAKVALTVDEDRRTFSRRLKQYCRERLAGFKVPVKVVLSERGFMGGRGKKVRVRG